MDTVTGEAVRRPHRENENFRIHRSTPKKIFVFGVGRHDHSWRQDKKRSLVNEEDESNPVNYELLPPDHILLT